MNNDLISREALRNSLLDSRPDNIEQSDINFDTCDIKIWLSFVLKTIDNAPTVEPTFGLFKEMLCSECEKRPQGEWKETGYETGALGITYRQTQCSNCGWEHALPMWLNYCPNCGADMQKGGAENDK